MPEQDFIPKDDMDFGFRLHNFIDQVDAHPTHFGIPPADLAQLRAETKSWDAAHDVQLKAQIDLRASERKFKDAEQKYRNTIQAYNDAVQESGADQAYKSALQAYNDALQNRPFGLPPMPDMPLPPAGRPSGPPAQEEEGEEWKGGESSSASREG